MSSRNGAGRLDGRVAIVSGGAGGIGQGVAGLFVAEGASVMVCDLPESEGKAFAQSLGPAAGYTALDVRDPRQWRNAVEACTAQFGAEPDILVQTAGIMVFGPIDTGDPEQFRTAFEVNVMGTLNGIQAVAPGMRRGGRGAIVVVTSMAGVTFACKAMGPYAASKAAASSLVRTAALDFAGTGIRVNSIVPGQIDTPMSRAAGVTAEFFEQMPIPRIGQPRDIANAALYLSSDESSWVTGTDLLVDGGMEAGPVLG
ncbi:SDR family NAD(P)-dependent oxidoreductase [Actinomadura formosensis]|uniref:SDR family NAD(P)-dependent oxidoreductase n=1 Tax=Actinomadura formosensis TaxID=60706 RepID=UPI003D9047ED